MLEHIITAFSANDFLSALSHNVDIVSNLFTSYFAGSNNLKIISIILITLALILFLFLIIVLYVKSIVVFLKNDQIAKQKSSSMFFKDMSDDDEYEDELDREQELERELELENELKKELEHAKNQRISQEQVALAKQQREDEAKEKELEKEVAAKRKEKELELDFDWQKGKNNELENSGMELSAISLEYHQSKKNLNELLGLIIDMLGRGVDDLKIAQTIMYRNQGLSTEEDVLQTIDAIKDFIALCINDRFKNMRSTKKLPSEEQALYHLANGDPSLSLALLEGLMHHNVNQSIKLGLGPKRDSILRETSHHAVAFGSLASLNDIHLATNSFELAIELDPQNITAWGRLGDMYNVAESHKKAVWAYESLLKMADEEIYPRQVANAYKMLSKYHYEKGDSLQAAKFYNSSKSYYDSIGINRRLDRQELEIIDVIEEKRNNDMEATVSNILASKHLNQYSYVS